MEKIDKLPLKIFILVLATVLPAVSAITCSKPAPDMTTAAKYRLTHTDVDAEHILSWDSIISLCPDIGAYDKQAATLPRQTKFGWGQQRSRGDSGPHAYKRCCRTIEKSFPM